MSDYIEHGIKIVQSAVKVKFEDGHTSTIVGVRHHDCYHSEHLSLLIDKHGMYTWRQEGFITNEPDRPFYGRVDAMLLVIRNKQCTPPMVMIEKLLEQRWELTIELNEYDEIEDAFEYYNIKDCILGIDQDIERLESSYCGNELFSEDLW